MRIFLVAVCFVALPHSSAWGVTFRVDPEGGGGGDITTIQAAIDSAAAGDTLLLSPVVFPENPLIVDKDLTIRAGAGGKAILDGALGPGVSGDGGNVLRTVRSLVRLEDLVLRNGVPRPTGCALMVFGGGVELRRCRVENSVFGVLSVDQVGPGSVDLEDCEIVGNELGVQGRKHTRIVRTRIEGNGEGMRAVGVVDFSDLLVIGNGRPGLSSAALVLGNASGRLERVQVRNNWSSSGPAGLWLRIGPYHVIDCVVEGNTSQSGSAGVVVTSVDEGRLLRCTVRSNESHGKTQSVAGLWVDRSALRATACRIENNESEDVGGGVQVIKGSVLEMESCHIVGNRSIKGGGLYARESSVLLDSVVVAGNRAAGGGALAADVGGRFDLRNCTLAANTGDLGAALYTVGGTASLAGCIIAAHVGAPTFLSSGSTSFACSDLFGNAQNTVVGTDLGGNVSLDPGFCALDAAGGSFDLRLSETSPLVNLPGCGRLGALPVGCSGTHVQPLTWSQLKSLYRGGNGSR
jgi:hypothetical protein